MSFSQKNLHKCELKKEDDIEIIEGSKQNGFCAALKRKWKSLIVLSIKHPLCSKYFKSESTVIEEKRKQLTSDHPYIIHPLSKLRIWYETYLVVLYFMALMMNPIEAAYARKSLKEFMVNYYHLQTIVDILCLLDVIINFFTGYIIESTRTIEIRPKKIAKNYLTSYFFFDVLSSIPRHAPYLIFPPPYPPSVILGLLSFFRLLKGPRLSTLTTLINRVAAHLNIRSNAVVRVTCAIVLMLNFLNFYTCLQTVVPRLADAYFTSKYQKLSWIYNYNINELQVGNRYIFASFRAIAYFLGIRLRGMFDTQILSDYATAILTLVIGKIFMGVFWIVLSSSIVSSRMMEIKYNEVINQLNEYMRQKQLPQSLKDRLIQYYRFKYQKKYLREDMITTLLSESLKKEVNIHTCKVLLSNVTLFSQLTKEQINQIVPKLVSEIFLPTDRIIQSGTEGHSMYFLSSGTVAVFTHSGREICHLTDGAYFGEISLVMKRQMRVATVIAVEITQVYRLDKKNFNKVMMKNKAIFKSIVACAERRLQEASDLEETYKRMLFEKEHTIEQAQENS